ncbi:MAG: hypothetical protein LBQ43_01045 [Holosporales bacterium]|jgi:hypothetical protein|nr:hypothetical protein [Holosporales bacterium]
MRTLRKTTSIMKIFGKLTLVTLETCCLAHVCHSNREYIRKGERVLEIKDGDSISRIPHAIMDSDDIVYCPPVMVSNCLYYRSTGDIKIHVHQLSTEGVRFYSAGDMTFAVDEFESTLHKDSVRPVFEAETLVLHVNRALFECAIIKANTIELNLCGEDACIKFTSKGNMHTWICANRINIVGNGCVDFSGAMCLGEGFSRDDANVRLFTPSEYFDTQIFECLLNNIFYNEEQ